MTAGVGEASEKRDEPVAGEAGSPAACGCAGAGTAQPEPER